MSNNLAEQLQELISRHGILKVQHAVSEMVVTRSELALLITDRGIDLVSLVDAHGNHIDKTTLRITGLRLRRATLSWSAFQLMLESQMRNMLLAGVEGEQINKITKAMTECLQSLLNNHNLPLEP